jgi:hypothetical protein
VKPLQSALTLLRPLPTVEMIVSEKLKSQILEQLDRLDDPQREQVLDFARRLAAPAGTPGRNPMSFAGSIDPADLKAMAEAIQEGCEKIESNAW